MANQIQRATDRSEMWESRVKAFILGQNIGGIIGFGVTLGKEEMPIHSRATLNCYGSGVVIGAILGALSGVIVECAHKYFSKDQKDSDQCFLAFDICKTLQMSFVGGSTSAIVTAINTGESGNQILKNLGQGAVIGLAIGVIEWAQNYFYEKDLKSLQQRIKQNSTDLETTKQGVKQNSIANERSVENFGVFLDKKHEQLEEIKIAKPPISLELSKESRKLKVNKLYRLAVMGNVISGAIIGFEISMANKDDSETIFLNTLIGSFAGMVLGLSLLPTLFVWQKKISFLNENKEDFNKSIKVAHLIDTLIPLAIFLYGGIITSLLLSISDKNFYSYDDVSKNFLIGSITGTFIAAIQMLDFYSKPPSYKSQQ